MKTSKIDTSKLVAEGMYKELIRNRDAYLDRAREASELTIPQLFPPEGSDGNTNYPTPYQSLGAKGVNNLANKIILSLFPPATAFFKLGVNPAELAAMGKGQGDLQKAMYIIESAIVNEMEISGLRPKLVHLIKQLIVGGSSVIYVPDSGSPEVFKMDQFGVKRDRQGNVLRLVICEDVMYQSLTEEVQAQIPKEHLTDDVLEGKKSLKLYTAVVKTDTDMYNVWQEINGTRMVKTEGSYKTKDCPYKFIPFVDTGEDYGRSYIEDFIGDLQSYEGFRQSILEASAESARVIYLLRPNSILSVDKLRKAKSGDVLVGNVDDIATLQNDKRMDLSVTQREAENLKMDLAMLFLLDSAVRRDAERVTAEEIRRVSSELEVALGGIYSTLASVLQEPLVRLYLNRLTSKGKLADVVKDSLDLEITTGSAALGRGTDFNVLATFIGQLGQVLQNPAAGQYIQVSELIKRMAYSLDINTGNLVVSDEERAAMAQAQQQAQLQQQVAPELVKGAMKQPTE